MPTRQYPGRVFPRRPQYVHPPIIPLVPYNPPVFVAEYETIWTTSTTPKTISVTTAIGDTLVVCAASNDAASPINAPTGGTALSWSPRQSVVVASHCTVYLWTAVASVAETFTMSLTDVVGGAWGFDCLRFSGSTGIGAASSGQVDASIPDLALTTQQNNSAIVVLNTDRLAGSGARTWRTGAGALTEVAYQVASAMTVYLGYHANAGPAGTYQVGLTAPSNQYYSIAALEIIGTPVPSLIPGAAFLNFM